MKKPEAKQGATINAYNAPSADFPSAKNIL
jgi:hypothetical protein